MVDLIKEWPSLPTLVSIAVVLLDLYALSLAVYRAHGVEGTLAWMFAIVAFPGFGAVAYLAIANPSVLTTARKKRRVTSQVRVALAGRGNESRGQLVVESPAAADMLNLSSHVTHLPPTNGNQVELLSGDIQAFQQIGQALRSAKRFIWAEYYLIRNDETGHLFLDLLAERAASGVQVRLLYDAVGSLRLDARRLAAIRAAGGAAEVFLPVNPLRRRWAVHLRNHRKMIIVDGTIGFTGGMNVGDEYSGRARRKGAQFFRDSHLAIRGPAVGDLAQIFAEDWLFANGETLDLPDCPRAGSGENSIVAVVPSGPDQTHNASGIVYFGGVNSARDRVYLVSPYFIPDQPMVRALQTAALRGVDVRILVPARNDVMLVGPAARSYFPDLVRSGVRVFEYMPSMLHAKTMVVDGQWGIVGSANVDIRSFHLNFELSALVVDRQLAAELERRFRDDLRQSREVTAETLRQASRLRRLGEGAARLLSPLM